MKKPDTKHAHRECRDLFARMSEYLDDELEPAVRRKLEQHLDDCPACRICLVTLQRTAALCREIGSLQIPDEVSQRLKNYFASITRGK